MVFSQILVLAAASALLATRSVPGEKEKPAAIEPIEKDGIRYEVPHFADGTRKHDGGYVQAWDVLTGNLLWEKEVYSPDDEQLGDYIETLGWYDGKLVGRSESGLMFSLEAVSPPRA